MTNLEITMKLFEDAIAAAPGEVASHKLTDDGLEVVSKVGHRFILNPASGIDKLLINCGENGVILLKNYALENELHGVTQAVVAEVPTPDGPVTANPAPDAPLSGETPSDESAEEFQSLSRKKRGKAAA